MVNDAQIRQLTTAEALRELVARSPGRATGALAAEVPLDQHGATRSILEDLLFDLHRDFGLPLPEINAIRHGVECDFSYPALRLVVEVDGWETHRTRQAFENDRAKRLHLEAHGERVIVVTYRQLTRERDRTADQLVRVMRASATSSRR